MTPADCPMVTWQVVAASVLFGMVLGLSVAYMIATWRSDDRP